MVDRIRVLRAWILRRVLMAGLPLGLVAAMLAWVGLSGDYPAWLQAILLPVLLVSALALTADLREVVDRARRRKRRSMAEAVQPAVALAVVLLAAVAPRLLVMAREPAPVLADLPARPPMPRASTPPADEAPAPPTPPRIRDEVMALLEPIEDVILAEAPIDTPAPPPAAAPVAAAPTEVPPPPAFDEAETLRFRPDLEDLLAFSHRSPERRTLALPLSLRVEMTLYLEEAEEAEGSGFLAEVDVPLGRDEGFRVFFQTTAESVEEGLFDDGPTWSWQRARIDYVRRVPFIEAVDLRVSAGLAFDRFTLTEEVGISEARGGAPVFGLEMTVVDEGPLRFVLHAAYTPATELADHHAVVTELGATAYIRIIQGVHLTLGWRVLEVRLREEVDGLTHRWDDEVSGPTFGLEIRL